MIRAIIAAFLIAAALTGCTRTVIPAPELISPPTAQFDTFVVARGNHAVLDQRAGVTRYMSQPLYFRSLSTFGQFHVSPGEFVTEGQLLAVLDTVTIEERITAQQETISNMRRDNALINDIRQLDIDIMILEQTNRIAQNAYNLDYETSEATQLIWTNIERAQLDLRQQRDRQNFQLQQAETRLADLRQQLIDAELRAPFDGQITNVQDIAQGQPVAAMQPIIFISSGDEIVIEAVEFFTGNWLGAPGDAAQRQSMVALGRGIIHMARKSYALIDGQRYEIEYIPMPVEDRAFRPVRFNIIGSPPLAGRYVALHFYRQYFEDVLIVPENAVFSARTHYYVYKIVNGELVYTEVNLHQFTQEVGIIASGLNEGDVVFVRP